jgi:glycine cleavage system regulatory protein
LGAGWALVQCRRKSQEVLRRFGTKCGSVQKVGELVTILAELGKPREAVTQLETALQLLPPRAEIHRKLADLDSEHRRLAEQIEADQAKDKPKKDESK